MTSRWDETAMTLIRDVAGDLTALDAAVESLKLDAPNDRMLAMVDRLVKQCMKRQLDLLDHLKG